MAESTLTYAFADFQAEVALFAGWDRTIANWTTDNTADFGYILKSGLRKAYYPPPIEAGKPRHEWSWLKPSTTLALANTDFDYDLPDDFSGVMLPDSVTFNDGDAKRRLEKITDSHLRALQSKSQQSGTPFYYALRPKAHAPTTGHRYELLVYPTPNGTMTLRYRYVAVPNTLDATNKYPYGGGAVSEMIMEAILAAAEEHLDQDSEGIHQKRFLELVTAAIRADDEQNETTEGVIK